MNIYLKIAIGALGLVAIVPATAGEKKGWTCPETENSVQNEASVQADRAMLRGLVEALKSADKNGDQKVTEKEAAATPALTLRFAEVDLNSDGAIVPGEVAQWLRNSVAAQVKRTFKIGDIDGNGELSKVEAGQFKTLEHNFEAFDKDGSGSLSSEEVLAVMVEAARG